jgi:GNAT superfamily N-acetyltransferase
MEFSANPVPLQDILPWRDSYRQSMHCQIVHDSLHPREGWTQSYLLEVNGTPAGYGAIVVGGPWKGTRTVFEFYVTPNHQDRVFDLFASLLAASSATGIETQTNDPQLTIMLHAHAHNIESEKIVFEDGVTTTHAVDGVSFRKQESSEGGEYVLEIDGSQAARGGILFHYNRPYGDIYMSVSEPFRRRGLGSYLVQELKRLCYEMGSIPCARCNTENIASRKTLQKAGFVPCAHMLKGSL